jgi:hypothetical protein
VEGLRGSSSMREKRNEKKNVSEQALRELRDNFSFVFNSLLCICELAWMYWAIEFELSLLYYSLYSTSVNEFLLDRLRQWM